MRSGKLRVLAALRQNEAPAIIGASYWGMCVGSPAHTFLVPQALPVFDGPRLLESRTQTRPLRVGRRVDIPLALIHPPAARKRSRFFFVGICYTMSEYGQRRS